MHDEERALLAAIIAHPDEDTPRLVYADWLQEHDQPERAEYIRLSIQLANLQYGDPNFKADEARLLAQRRPLVEQYYDTWKDEFAEQFPATRELYWHPDHGMFGGVCCSVKYFLDNGNKLFESTPLRWFMPATLSPTTAKRLVAHPLFRRLRELRVPNLKNAPALLDCAAIEINSLSFYQFLFFSSGEWDAFAVRLAAHPGLKTIKRIDFENCGLGDQSGEALAAAPHIAPDVLNLLNNSFFEPVRKALRKRYGPRVWIDQADRNGTPRGTR